MIFDNKTLLLLVAFNMQVLSAMAPVNEFKVHLDQNKGLYALELLKSGNIVLTPDNNNTIIMTDHSGMRLDSFVGHNGHIECIQRNYDETLIATGAVDSTVKVWDIGSKTILHNFEVPDNVVSASFDLSGNLLATYAYWHNRLDVFDLKSGKIIKTVKRTNDKKDSKDALLAVQLMPSGQDLFLGRMGSSEGDAILQRVDSRSLEVKNIYYLPCGDINCFAASPDGNYLAVSDAGREGLLVDAHTGKLAWDFVPSDRPYEEFSAHLAFDRTSEYLCAGRGVNDALIVNVRSQQKRATLKNSANVHRVTWNGNYIAGAFPEESLVRIWDISSVTKSRLSKLTTKCRELISGMGCSCVEPELD